MNQNEMQDIIESAFERVGRLREMFGLPTVVDTPVLDPEYCVDSAGTYQSCYHLIALGKDFLLNAYGWRTIYHECCHAHQRVALRDREVHRKLVETSYLQRWSEIEARKIAYLCILQDVGVELRPGDYDRVEEVIPNYSIRMTRSLRLRVNSNPMARKVRY